MVFRKIYALAKPQLSIDKEIQDQECQIKKKYGSELKRHF